MILVSKDIFFLNLNYLLVSLTKITLVENDVHNKKMISTTQAKKEISKNLKRRAIYEGFTLSGIASIPGS